MRELHGVELSEGGAMAILERVGERDKTPLSESGPGGPSQLSKVLFLLEVKVAVNPSKPAFFKAEI